MSRCKDDRENSVLPRTLLMDDVISSFRSAESAVGGCEEDRPVPCARQASVPPQLLSILR